MNNEALAVIDDRAIDHGIGRAEKPIVITTEQADLVKATVAADATDAELALFFYDCRRRGVHPLDKLIHFTKRKGKYTPVTAIDFFRSRAAQTREHMGTDDVLYAGTPGEMDFTATVTVYRMVQGERCAFTATARMSEYMPEPPNDFMWKKMPHGQLGKCAEALALRKGFPQELEGLHTVDEMDQAQEGRPAAPRTVSRMSERAVDATTTSPGFKPAALTLTAASKVKGVRGVVMTKGKSAGKTMFVCLLEGSDTEYTTYDEPLAKEIEHFVGTDHLVRIGFDTNEWNGRTFFNAKSVAIADDAQVTAPAPPPVAKGAPMTSADIPFGGR